MASFPSPGRRSGAGRGFGSARRPPRPKAASEPCSGRRARGPSPPFLAGRTRRAGSPWCRQNRRVLELFPDTRPARGRRALARRHPGRRARRASTAARSSSTTRRRCAPGPAPTARPRPSATVVYGTKAFPNVALMRLLAEEGIGADVSTLGELRFARGGRDRRRARSSSTATTSRDEELEARRGGGRARRDRLARGDRARPRRRRGADARPRHPRDRAPTPTRRSAPATTARSSGSRPTTRSKPCALDPETEGLHRPHRLPACATSAPPARRSTGSRRSRPAPAASSAGTLRTLDLGGGLGVAATPDEHELLDRRLRRRPARRARPRLPAGGDLAAPGDPRARPLADGPRRRDALHGRLGQALGRRDRLRRGRRRHVRQPAPRALRRPLHRAARRPRRRADERARTRSSASTASPATS